MIDALVEVAAGVATIVAVVGLVLAAAVACRWLCDGDLDGVLGDVRRARAWRRCARAQERDVVAREREAWQS